MNNLISDVLLFHKTFGHPVLPSPAIPSPERQVLRNKLIRDEWLEELDPAWAELAKLKKLEDQGKPIDPTTALAEFGDAIADVIYYLIGTAHEYGIPLQEIWDAVQTANMSKLWTQRETSQEGIQMNFLECGWKSRVALPNADLSDPDARIISVTDETGKVRKPPSWKEPDIRVIIRKAMGCTDQSTSS